MPVLTHTASEAHVRPIVGAIQTLGVNARLHTASTAVVPFVTISRQAGAGGLSIGNSLVEHLNQIDPGESPWTAWDRELVQKVSEEHRIAQTLVETLEDRAQSWLEELLGGLRVNETPDSASEFRVFWRTAATIRAIAQVGRAVIVGRGGALITRSLPGGIHIRLIAPLPFRIRNFAETYGLDAHEAELRVKEIDRNRDAFYRRHWPDKALTPEVFTATFNTSVLSESTVVRAIATLIAGRQVR